MPNPYYNPYWLEHHGVKGQSWGDRNGPPYPLSRGKDGRVTQTQKKKKQSLIARMKAEHQKKVKVKQRAKAKAEKAKKAEENLSKEELREKLLKSTDPKFIAKHVDLLDTKEIKDRLDRIDTEKRLKNLTKDETSKKKIDRGMEMVKHISTIADATSKAAKAYNDVMEATGKKVKTDSEAKESKAKAAKAIADKKEAERKAKDNIETSKKILGILDEYSKKSETYSDVEIVFNPTTGQLIFKSKKK